METTAISNYKQLTNRIETLKSEFEIQNNRCIESYKNFSDKLDPVSLLKHGINEISKDENTKLNLAKLSLNAGASFIIDRILGRNKSIKGFISSILIERISEMVINENTSKIISFIKNKLFTKKEHQNN